MDAIAHCLNFLGDDMRDLEMLRRGLQQAESAGFVYMLARAGVCLPKLCNVALAQQVHVAFVRRLIATNKLLPPEGAGPHWPWSVRIRTLGGFSLEISDETYRPSRKAQDKPLELLKLLVCCQAMRRSPADKQWLAQRLWPDADDANARKSLDMTLSRLRRLLRDDATIVASESRLALSATHVWTDIAPLLDALSRVSEVRDRHAGGSAPHGAAASAEVAAMLEHFKGPFLPEDEGPPWLLAGREAVAASVRSTLLIEGNKDPRFIDALERAFGADPTSEDLARALMRSLIRSGQHAEALRVYRRLREMLSVVLGVTPARETEQLRQQVHAEASASIASAAPASG
jgi:LuxR family transcriptional regulator, maltose regulon positive regulatory protein